MELTFTTLNEIVQGGNYISHAWFHFVGKTKGVKPKSSPTTLTVF